MLKIKKKHRKKLFFFGMLILVFGALFLACLLSPPEDASVPKVTPQEPTETTPEGGYLPTDFKRNEKGFMECLTADCDTGIDVSEYQKEVDWDQVKAAGVSFVFIRLGHRGTTEGKLYTDIMASTHYEGAKKAGLQVGMYFFSQAVTVEEAREEAAFVLENIEGYQLELPVVFDWERGGKGSRTENLAASLLTDITKTFCRNIADGGFSPMIYFNQSQGMQDLDLETLDSYPFWLARYEDTLYFPYTVSYWQYSDQGHIDGIEGNVDLNLRLPQA